MKAVYFFLCWCLCNTVAANLFAGGSIVLDVRLPGVEDDLLQVFDLTLDDMQEDWTVAIDNGSDHADLSITYIQEDNEAWITLLGELSSLDGSVSFGVYYTGDTALDVTANSYAWQLAANGDQWATRLPPHVLTSLHTMRAEPLREYALPARADGWASHVYEQQAWGLTDLYFSSSGAAMSRAFMVVNVAAMPATVPEPNAIVLMVAVIGFFMLIMLD